MRGPREDPEWKGEYGRGRDHRVLNPRRVETVHRQDGSGTETFGGQFTRGET